LGEEVILKGGRFPKGGQEGIPDFWIPKREGISRGLGGVIVFPRAYILPIKEWAEGFPPGGKIGECEY